MRKYFKKSLAPHYEKKIVEVRIIRRTLFTWIGIVARGAGAINFVYSFFWIFCFDQLKIRSWIGAETRVYVEKQWIICTPPIFFSQWLITTARSPMQYEKGKPLFKSGQHMTVQEPPRSSLYIDRSQLDLGKVPWRHMYGAILYLVPIGVSICDIRRR